MTAPIPVALRQRIVDAVSDGMTWDEAAEVFKVGIATVNRLVRKYREGSSLEPLGHGGGQRHRIPDEHLDRLRAIVERTPDATIAELAETYRVDNGVSVGESTVGRALERLGLSRKKRPSSTRSARGLAFKKRGSRSAI
jgi:transposase